MNNVDCELKYWRPRVVPLFLKEFDCCPVHSIRKKNSVYFWRAVLSEFLVSLLAFGFKPVMLEWARNILFIVKCCHFLRGERLQWWAPAASIGGHVRPERTRRFSPGCERCFQPGLLMNHQWLETSQSGGRQCSRYRACVFQRSSPCWYQHFPSQIRIGRKHRNKSIRFIYLIHILGQLDVTRPQQKMHIWLTSLQLNVLHLPLSLPGSNLTHRHTHTHTRRSLISHDVSVNPW